MTTSVFGEAPIGQSESALEKRNRLVMEYLPLVKAIAIRVRDGLPSHVELDDLIHAGLLGLTDAATKFDSGRKVSFSVYARYRIRGAILDSLREMDWVSRDLRRRHKQAERVTRELSTGLQRQPTEEEVAARMGIDVSRWRQIALDLHNLGLVSASTRGQEGDDLPAPDFPAHPDSRPDNMCARGELREKLEAAMRKLPERYRKVVALYYAHEMTMKEIGGVLGVNESRVSQIQKSALTKLAEALQAKGITSSRAF
ncbi:MAG: FliA/WhiG family RNA polymerase sigma factor [Acidobacteria bacterium]|nr:FliA/WhiG family RNA polymerase sigma factor [Acidobacteriota bacterium]